MGRHGQPRSAGISRGVLAAALGMALLVAGGFAARALISDDTPATTATARSSSDTSSDAPSDTSSASSTAASSTTSDTSSGAPSQSSSSTTTEPPARPAALGACARETAAGDALVAAAQESARDWRIHTSAQVKYDKGTFTRQQTLDTWAESKARGPADLKAVSKASKAYDKVKGACARLADDTVPSRYAAAADRCTTRATVMRRAISDGLAVNREWAAHITMMANKEKTDGAAYHARWMRMVKNAPKSLDTFASSSAKLDKAPTCTSV